MMEAKNIYNIEYLYFRDAINNVMMINPSFSNKLSFPLTRVRIVKSFGLSIVFCRLNIPYSKRLEITGKVCSISASFLPPLSLSLFLFYLYPSFW